MPKCPKCGRKFTSLQALTDHFHSVHPNDKFVPPKQASSARTLIVIIVIVIIVMGSLVGYLIYAQVHTTTTTYSFCTSCIGETISPALYQNLSVVSFSTLSTIGSQPSLVTPPSAITGSALTDNGKPEVLYIGAEFCPYCGAERWAMIVALSKFGTFSNISLMLSSATDIYANTPTFSFVNSTYSSTYISFVSVEDENRLEQPLQTLTSAEQSLLSQYDPPTSSCTSGGCIPFIDIGGSYTVIGAQFVPTALRVGDTASGAPYNWTQVGSQLNNPNSLFAQAIDGSANTLIKAICSITNNSPASVCSESYLSQISLSISPQTYGSQGSPIISVVRPFKLEAM